jgi:uncharacterized protein (TIGR02246 family)
MTKDQAAQLIATYGKAWEQRDADLILTVFTPDATYFDPREGVQTGHAGIKAYWESKVIGSQKNITFKLLNLWMDADTVIIYQETPGCGLFEERYTMRMARPRARG